MLVPIVRVTPLVDQPAQEGLSGSFGNSRWPSTTAYQLVRERETVRELTLEITFVGPGAEAYAFTFG